MKIVMAQGRVWRVGFPPEPWDWAGWRWAGSEGRFNGRWDSLTAKLYRTVYAGESLYACFVELLAPLRPDEFLAEELDEILENEEDAKEWPTVTPGHIDIDEWCGKRLAGSAQLAGRFVDITASATVAELYSHFIEQARVIHGLKDFDASALKNPEQRSLTQSVSEFLWKKSEKGTSNFCDGINFRSRHGDDLVLWAIFERPEDGERSRLVTDIQTVPVDREMPELVAAIKQLGLITV